MKEGRITISYEEGGSPTIVITGEVNARRMTQLQRHMRTAYRKYRAQLAKQGKATRDEAERGALLEMQAEQEKVRLDALEKKQAALEENPEPTPDASSTLMALAAEDDDPDLVNDTQPEVIVEDLTLTGDDDEANKPEIEDVNNEDEQEGTTSVGEQSGSEYTYS